MRIETHTDTPSQLDDYELIGSYQATFMGDPVTHPALIQARDADGRVAYELHLTRLDLTVVAETVLHSAKHDNTDVKAYELTLTPEAFSMLQQITELATRMGYDRDEVGAIFDNLKKSRK